MHVNGASRTAQNVGRRGRCCTLAAALAVAAVWPPGARGQGPPLTWQAPAGFNAGIPGAGMTPLGPAAQHRVIFDPLPSTCNVNEGGSGQYESVRHGMYSHHGEACLFEDKFLVFWTNHSRDENGPGQRILAKVGTFSKDRTAIDWGGDETLVAVAPAPVPVRRRTRTHDPNVINEHFFYGSPMVINGRLYFSGHMTAVHGYTDKVEYKHMPLPGGGAIPAEHWRDARDTEAGFAQEVYWSLGYRFVQRWRVAGATIVPDSSVYRQSDMMASPVEVTPGRFKTILEPSAMYADALPFDDAPAPMRDDILNGTRITFRRRPRYENAEAMRVATDGSRGLSHYAEFQRPDGKWVVIRDNVAPGTGGAYYAALKDNLSDYYPPGIRTSLPGYAMPAAGELPNGWCWILGNLRSRQEIYLTVSTNGVAFQHSRHLLTYEGGKQPDRIGGGGGPQYPHALVVSNNIWIAYSLAKVKMGVTRVPVDALTALYGAPPATPPPPRRPPLTSAGWRYRQGVTINPALVAADLINFPVLIDHTDAQWRSLAQGGRVAQEDGGDICFTAADGTNQLDHELESYNAVSGHVTAWVRLPALSAQTDNAFFMTYGNTAGGLDEQNPAGVWDADYIGVWHMGETNGMTLRDSTAAGYHAAAMREAMLNAPGRIGGGVTFNGENDYVNEPSVLDLVPGGRTVSCWVRKGALSKACPLVMSYSTTAEVAWNKGLALRLGNVSGSPTYNLNLYVGDGTIRFQGSTTVTLAPTTWCYAVGTWDGTAAAGAAQIYLNGVTVTGGTLSSGLALAQGSRATQFGRGVVNATGTVQWFDGIMDEVRISRSARSAGWIQTEYNNQSRPADFVGFGSSERMPGAGPRISRIQRPAQGRVALTFQTDAGQNYALRYATNLVAAAVNWLPVDATAGDGGAITLTDANATAPARFYRVFGE